MSVSVSISMFVSVFVSMSLFVCACVRETERECVCARVGALFACLGVYRCVAALLQQYHRCVAGLLHQYPQQLIEMLVHCAACVLMWCACVLATRV